MSAPRRARPAFDDRYSRSPIAFGLATVLVLGVLLALWLSRTYDSTLAAAYASNRSAALAYAANVERLLESADENNRFLLAWHGIDLDDQAQDQLLRLQKRASPQFMDLLLLDGDGRILHWSASGPIPVVRDRPYFRALADDPGLDLHVDEARPSRVNIGRWFLSYSRAARAADGRLERVAVAILDAAMFDDSIRRFGERFSATLMLVHAGGRLVAHSARPNAHGDAAPPAVLAGHPTQTGSGPLVWVEPVGRTPLSVAVETDRREALAPWRERATVSALLFMLGSAVILVLSITQARHARRLAETEHLYRALTEQSLVGILLIDDDRVLYANPRLAEILAIPPEQCTHRQALIERIVPDDRERTKLQFARWQHDPGARSVVSFSAAGEAGSIVDLEAQGRQVVIDGKLAALVVVTDVSDQASARRTLHAMAYHDALTGLANRALLFDRLTQVLSRMHRTGERFALMLIDLDGFKGINDLHGHEAGDLVLRTVAERLLSALRESDTVARMGGDEFLVVLETTAATADAQNVARKILAELARPIALPPPAAGSESPALAVSGSIGIAMFPDHGEDVDTLVAAADAAMYAAKKAGKNAAVVATAGPRPSTGRSVMLIEWSPEYMLGYEAIDSQHRQLFALCNALALTFSDPQGVAQRAEAMTALNDYAGFHFRTEEDLMADSGYVGAEGHARQHRDLERKLANLEHLLVEHGPSMALKTLRDWLLLHVGTTDRQLAVYLRERELSRNSVDTA